jgi:transglutaminase-like putative cysteine protease
MTQMATTPLPDRPQLATDGKMTYILRQRFSYAYDTPVRDLDHRLVVVPPRRHGTQRLLWHSIAITGSAADARTTHRRNAAGNLVTRYRAPLVPDTIEFALEAVIERDGPGFGASLPAAALTDPRLLRPTRLTAADTAIRRLAATMAGQGGLADQDGLAAADRICAYVHQAIDYVPGATSVDTTAAEALAGGQGVCQDSAHVMIALCRAIGLPARYVSGHLRGEGGTHAWVEVIVPDMEQNASAGNDGSGARAVALDPCNGCRAGLNYLTVATGRDYTDVAPTSGTYMGTANSTLTTSKQVDVLAGPPPGHADELASLA